MRNPRTLYRMWIALLGAILVSCACVSVPKLRTDYVGVGDLPLQLPEQDLPPYADATELAQLPGHEEDVPRPAYRIGPLDELVVVVWGREDLGSQVPVGQSGQLRGSGVREDGTVVMPFLGPLKVTGLTLEEIRSLIQSRYATLIENPQVEVALHRCGSRSVQVGGAVAQPGAYYLCDDVLTLGEVLAAARGVTETADLGRGILTRYGRPYHLDYAKAVRGASRASEVVLQHGDQIYFPDARERVVYIFGEVVRQGIYPIPPEGLTILGALGQARGLDTDSAKHEGIYLMRQQPSGVVAYKLKMADLVQGEEIPLIDGDRLYVTMTPLERWDRWWRKALPFTTVRTDVQFGGE